MKTLRPDDEKGQTLRSVDINISTEVSAAYVSEDQTEPDGENQ